MDAKLDRLGEAGAKANTRPSNPDIDEIPSSVRADPEDGRRNPGVLLRVTGEESGVIEGSVADDGHAGAIAVKGMSHGVSQTRDQATGLPTGKRQHKPVRISKPIDKSTPRLFSSMITNENLPSVEISFYRDGAAGEEEYFTITLQNARISGIETALPNIEQIEFVYSSITWDHGGTTMQDDWQSPVLK